MPIAAARHWIFSIWGDIGRAEWERYKVVVFANTFLLTDAEQEGPLSAARVREG